MGTPTTVDKEWLEQYDSLKTKYGIGLMLDGNFHVNSILGIVARLKVGEPRHREIFQMYTDEMMAEVLDEEDMAFWLKKKSEYS